MKKSLTFLCLLIATLSGSSFYLFKTSTGITGQTGSPGETTCSGNGSCHTGGNSAVRGLTISASPSFTAGQYMADSTYLISIQVAANGFARFGFGCEILDSMNVNAGTMQNPGSGVILVNHFNGRKNAIHSAKKPGTNGAAFTFEWIAPSEGKVSFFCCANAVNNNNNTSGDLPIPETMVLYSAPPPQDTTVIIDAIAEERSAQIIKVTVSPNPVHDLSTLHYTLATSREVSAVLVDLNGKVVTEVFKEKQQAGDHSRIINFSELPSGVYFLRFSSGGKKETQKLFIKQ